MKWVLFGAAIIAICSVVFIKRATNNVCKTFDDYYSDRDSNENCYHNPDHELTVPEIIERNGYPVETHHVTTSDGYIVTMFRIPYGKNSADRQIGSPVFLQHGFFSSSACFVTTTTKKSLGFILADKGYDVWLGNFRGSIYSRNHTHLSDTESAYWNFSFHEYGIYDLPAQLDLVSKVTKQKITFVGFSMGTMAMYIYGTTYPEAALEKIKIFVNLAPSAFLGELKSVLKYILPFWYLVEPAVQAVTQGKLFARLSMPELLRKVCYPFPIQMKFCLLPEMIIFGFNYDQTDPETLPVYFLQHADWASVKGFSHMAQLVLSGNFQHYDYGYTTNTQLYGSAEPPHYNLTKMRVPTYFIRAQNDLVITKENVERLYDSLPQAVKPYDIYVIEDENFNHLDFVTAKDVVPLVYDHVVDFISKH